MDNRSAWLRYADDAAQYMKLNAEPLCFFLGAGASISSGAPSTEQVDHVLNQAYGEGEGTSPDRYYEARRDVSVKEKTNHLRPLFANTVPHVGYRCLASLARHRRVMIVNLNWDNLAARACQMLGVRPYSFDLGNAEERADALKAIENEDFRVICAHAHGRLEGNPRRRRRDTLKFGNDEKSLLREHFFHWTTVVAGASLTQDTDVDEIVADLLDRSETEASGSPSWWFLRHAKGTRGTVAGGGRHLCEDPRVDFDRLMVRMAAKLNDRPYRRFIDQNPTLKIPNDENLVVPRPEIMRELMTGETAVLAGPPRLGKTTAAALSTYWRFVYEPQPPTVVQEEGAGGCAGGLAPHELQPNEIRLLDAPFGTTEEFEENPSFVEGFLNLSKDLAEKNAGEQIRRTPKVIVTTRSGNWAQAMAAGHAASLRTLSPRAADWYAKRDLLEVVDALQVTEDLKARLTLGVRNGEITTPAQVKFALATGSTSNISERSYREEFLSDRRMLLEAHPTVARLALHVRLQSFSHELTPAEVLVRQADVHSGAVRLAEGMVSRASLDDFDYWTLEHSLDVQAVDDFIAAHGSRVANIIEPPHGVVPWVRDALDVYRAQKTAQREGVDTLKATLGRELLIEWAPDLFAATADPKMLDIAPREDLDRWGENEMVHELVRLWEKVGRDVRVAKEMEVLLAPANPLGIYAVLQASLYLGPGVNVDVWDRVKAALWTIEGVLDPSMDVSDVNAAAAALSFDALVWRCPEESARSARAWLRRLMRKVGRENPLFGGMLFSVAYHFQGAETLLESLDLEEFQPSGLGGAQARLAAWMMEWHFLHQSRAWAFLARRSFKGKDHLARSEAGRPRPNFIAGKRVDGLVRDMTVASADTAGWAFHLALNAHWNISPVSFARMQAALERAAERDPGVITAALTYEIPDEVAGELQNYFAHTQNREALLDAMAYGVRVCDQDAAPPRFCFNRTPFRIQRQLEVNWRNLSRFFSGHHGVESFVARIPVLRDEINAEHRDVDRAALSEIQTRAERGDLRPIEDAAVARPKTPGDRNEKDLLISAVEMYSPPSLFG